jgi:transposase
MRPGTELGQAPKSIFVVVRYGFQARRLVPAPRNDIHNVVITPPPPRATARPRLVAASLQPGTVASAIAREAGIHVSQLFGWRRQLYGVRAGTFAAVHVAAEPNAAGTIEFASGARLRVNGSVDPALLSGAIAALAAGGKGRS